MQLGMRDYVIFSFQRLYQIIYALPRTLILKIETSTLAGPCASRMFSQGDVTLRPSFAPSHVHTYVSA